MTHQEEILQRIITELRAELAKDYGQGRGHDPRTFAQVKDEVSNLRIDAEARIAEVTELETRITALEVERDHYRVGYLRGRTLLERHEEMGGCAMSRNEPLRVDTRAYLDGKEGG